MKKTSREQVILDQPGREAKQGAADASTKRMRKAGEKGAAVVSKLDLPGDQKEPAAAPTLSMEKQKAEQERVAMEVAPSWVEGYAVGEVVTPGWVEGFEERLLKSQAAVHASIQAALDTLSNQLRSSRQLL